MKNGSVFIYKNFPKAPSILASAHISIDTQCSKYMHQRSRPPNLGEKYSDGQETYPEPLPPVNCELITQL